MKESKQKNIIIGSLIAVVLIMAIGYAAFATQLNINGSAAITSNWCVGFDNTKTSTYTTTTGVAGATAPTGTMSYSGNTCQSVASTVATLNTTLHQPGDRVVYTLTILNKGSVDATIDSVLVDDVSKTASYTETKGNIKFTVTMPVSNTVVATSGSTTMTVTAEFQNDTPVSSLDQAETQSINIKINAGEGSGSGESGSSFTGTIYRNSETGVGIGDSIAQASVLKWCAVEISTDEMHCEFDSESECNEALVRAGFTDTFTCRSRTVQEGGIGDYTTDASMLNLPVYLKHDVVNNIITASYVCTTFGVLSTPVCVRGGTENGENPSNFYNSNLAALNTLLNNSEFTGAGGTCSNMQENLIDVGYQCWLDSFVLTFYDVGSINAYMAPANNSCYIDGGGTSYCGNEK